MRGCDLDSLVFCLFSFQMHHTHTHTRTDSGVCCSFRCCTGTHTWWADGCRGLWLYLVLLSPYSQLNLVWPDSCVLFIVNPLRNRLRPNATWKRKKNDWVIICGLRGRVLLELLLAIFAASDTRLLFAFIHHFCSNTFSSHMALNVWPKKRTSHTYPWPHACPS